jgi:hypothetical protein
MRRSVGSPAECEDASVCTCGLEGVRDAANEPAAACGEGTLPPAPDD